MIAADRPRRIAAMLSLVLCLALLAASPADPDTVTLRNGDVIRCKVVQETPGLVKVRVPRRGKIITTFLSRGTIGSIERHEHSANRQFFQSKGVRNPSKTFEPVYYSGIRTATGGKPAGPGKAAKGRERGVDARRKASDARAKARESKGKEAASSTTPSAPGGGTTSPTTPVTTGGASTTTGARTGTGGSVALSE